MESTTDHQTELDKPGCKNRLVTALSLLLAVVFVISLPVALVMLDIGEVLFSPETISEAIVTNVLETGAFQDFLLEFVFMVNHEETGGSEVESIQDALEFLEPTDIEAILRILVPPDWLEIQINDVVNQFYRWLDNDQIYPRLLLDIEPIKARLLSGGSEDISDIILDSWPSCSMEQVNLIRNQFTRTGEIPPIACEPPEPMRQELLEVADGILRRRINQLPPSIRLFDPRAEDVRPSDALELKQNIRFIRAWFTSSWLLVFTALGLIMALRIRSFQDLARWWGYPLLASGIALFILVLMISEPFSRRIARALAAIDLPQIFRTSIEGIAHNLQEAFVGLALFQFILLIGSGIGLLLVAYLLRRRAQTEE